MPNEKEPLVSIITPAFNAEKFIGQALESVKAQTYGAWELFIVLDTKSSDRTSEIARQYAKLDSRIQVISSKTCQNIASNRNFGLEAARGDYVAFLDADDIWRPEKLHQQVQFMSRRSLDFSFHGYAVVDESGYKVGSRKCPESVRYDDLLRDNVIGCLSVMLRRSAIGDLRFQDVPHEDFAFWLDLLRKGTVAYSLPAELADYRIVKGSRSNNKITSAQWRWNILKKQPIPLSKKVSAFTWYAINAAVKRMG